MLVPKQIKYNITSSSLEYRKVLYINLKINGFNKIILQFIY